MIFIFGDLLDSPDLLPGIKARFRILFDLHHINPELFRSLAVEVESVSKQLAAWHAKTLERRRGEVPLSGPER